MSFTTRNPKLYELLVLLTWFAGSIVTGSVLLALSQLITYGNYGDGLTYIFLFLPFYIVISAFFGGVVFILLTVLLLTIQKNKAMLRRNLNAITWMMMSLAATIGLLYFDLPWDIANPIFVLVSYSAGLLLIAKILRRPMKSNTSN